MSDIAPDRIATEFIAAVETITAADLVELIPHIERFGLSGDLDLVFRTARPGVKVQRRFLPATVQAEAFKVGLRHAKAQELIQDAVVGLYYDELGDDVADPSLAQLQSSTQAVLGKVARPLVLLTLIGVVARDEVATPHAITVLRDEFACDLTK